MAKKSGSDRTFRETEPLVLGRPCPFSCTCADHSSKCRSLAHHRIYHHAVRCRFRCPGEFCTREFTPELNTHDINHLKTCFKDRGYIKSPQPFPGEYRPVKEKKKKLLKAGVGGDRLMSLAPLARRLLNEYERESKYDRIGTPRETRIPETTASTPRVWKGAIAVPESISPVPEVRRSSTPDRKNSPKTSADSCLKRRKVNMGPAAVPWRKKEKPQTDA